MGKSPRDSQSKQRPYGLDPYEVGLSPQAPKVNKGQGGPPLLGGYALALSLSHIQPRDSLSLSLLSPSGQINL